MRSNYEDLLDIGVLQRISEVNLCLTDCSKAFGCMDHEKLCVALKEKVVLQHLIVLRRNLFGGQEATVRPEYGERDKLASCR